MRQVLTKNNKYWFSLPMILILLFSPLGGVMDAKAGGVKSTLNQSNQEIPLQQSNVFNDVDSAWQYAGSWTEVQTDGAFGGQVHISSTLGDNAKIQMVGSSFTLVYSKSPEFGKLTIYVDGKKVKTIDQRGARTVPQKEWTNTALSPGEHTINIVNESGGIINIDAIKIGTVIPANTETPLPTNTPIATNIPPTNLPTTAPSEIPSPTAINTLQNPPTQIASLAPTSTPTSENQLGLGVGLPINISQTPYGGSIRTIPGTIQAEDFDAGGEGVAYHDASTTNEGGKYRIAEAVDIEATSDAGGGFNIGWIKAGEWYEYSVNLTASTSYSIGLRLANNSDGGSMHVEIDGINVTGPIAVPNTGGFQSWQTVTVNNISLPAGQHILRLVFDTPTAKGYVGNINSFTISNVTNPTTVPSIAPTNTLSVNPTGNPPLAPTNSQQIVSQAPYGGVIKGLPGTIQAEDFDTGGEGVAYHDASTTNEGNKYRTTEAVDIESTSDAGGGFSIGWIKAGEWYEYSVNLTASTSYSIGLRLANNSNGGSMHVEVDGINVTGPIAVPNTGGFQSWQTVTVNNISLPAGQHILRLVFDAKAANGYVGNINSFTLSTATNPTTVPSIAPTNITAASPTAIPSLVPTNPPQIVSQAPYGGVIKGLPGTIQAEDFDTGGEGVAYHDASTTNEGNKYRTTEAVDIEATSDAGGGFSIGWIKAGEWYEYSVNLTTSTSYSIGLRLANNSDGGSMHVEVDGINVTGPIAVPNTGGFQSWQTVTVNNISLPAGQHILRLVFDTQTANGYVGNINSFTISNAVNPTAVPSLAPTNTPAVNPTVIPSLVPTITPTTSVPVGNTLYVSPNGNDANSGSQAQPWKTIQKAANTAQPGQTIIVLAGTYNERVNISRSGSSSQRIVFQAQGSVVLRGFIVKANYVTIQGFEVNNPTYIRDNNEASSGIYLKGNYLIVENNYVHDSPRFGIYLDGTSIHDITVRSNRLFRNGDSGILISGNNHVIEANEIWETVQCHPTLLAVEGTSSCAHGTSLGLDADGMDFFGQGHVIRNNFIHDIRRRAAGVNAGSGDYNNDAHIDCFQTWAGTYGPAANIVFSGNRCIGLDGNAGWQLQSANNLTIKNNVVESPIGVNTASGGNHHLFITNNVFANNIEEGIELVNAPYTIVKNNILYNQSGQTIVLFGDKTGVEISYNIAYNANGSTLRCIVGDGYSCLNPVPANNFWKVDPWFINPVSGDYRPQAGSPACSGGSGGTYIGAYSCAP